MNLPGRPWDDESRTNLNTVGDGFFDTLRIPVVAGRTLERRDMRPDAEASWLSTRLLQSGTSQTRIPWGAALDSTPNENNRYEIVGVVGNSRYNSMRRDTYPTVYEPYRPGGTIHFAIRTSIDSARLAEAVRRAVASVDPAVPLTEFHTQTALIDRMLRTERLLGFVSGAFGAGRVDARRHRTRRPARLRGGSPHQRDRRSNGARCGCRRRDPDGAARFALDGRRRDSHWTPVCLRDRASA